MLSFWRVTGFEAHPDISVPTTFATDCSVSAGRWSTKKKASVSLYWACVPHQLFIERVMHFRWRWQHACAREFFSAKVSYNFFLFVMCSFCHWNSLCRVSTFVFFTPGWVKNPPSILFNRFMPFDPLSSISSRTCYRWNERNHFSRIN